jgi:hypothetical protein
VCKYKLKSRLIAVKVCADIYNKETLIKNIWSKWNGLTP